MQCNAGPCGCRVSEREGVSGAGECGGSGEVSGGHAAAMGLRTARRPVRASMPIRCVHGLPRRRGATSPFRGRRACGDGGWGMGSSHTQAAVRGILNVCLNSACDRYQPGRSPQHRESPGARERTIVSLIAQGQPNEEITRDLAIGVPLPGQIRKHSTFM
jgi:hypothetical protein